MAAANIASQSLARQDTNPAELMERVLIGGDLSKLTAPERLTYYKAVCESVSLNPLTKPFEYITLNGRLTLYARKDCTDQLRALHGVSITNQVDRVIEGIYVVTTYVQNAKGRTDVATGAVPIENLKGENRANAMMKAETKAKRRATLSICGLGMLDETEVESIPHAAPNPGVVERIPAKTANDLYRRMTPPQATKEDHAAAEVIEEPALSRKLDHDRTLTHCEAWESSRSKSPLIAPTPAFAEPAHEAAFQAQAPSEPPVIEAEAEPVAGEVPLLSKGDLLKVCKLTDRLEEYGVAPEVWRDYVEKITGQRSRKLIEFGDLGHVLQELSKALNAVIKERGGKK